MISVIFCERFDVRLRKKTCLRCDLTYIESMILFALLQPYSKCKNAWHVHWFWRISLKGLTCGCEEQLLALWFSTCLIYDSGCIAATTPCNHILTAKKTICQWFWWFSDQDWSLVVKTCEEEPFNVVTSGMQPPYHGTFPIGRGLSRTMCVASLFPPCLWEKWLGRKTSPIGRDGTGK